MRHSYRVFALILMILFIFTPAQAQVRQWTSPELIFQSSGGISSPLLLADRTGDLHLFWISLTTQSDRSSVNYDVIYYAFWDGRSWSDPVDIIAWPSIRSISAVVDHSGTVHLVWTDSQSLYYSQAEAALASRVSAWSNPVNLDYANPNIQITVDGANQLHLVYAGMGNSGIFYRSSTNSGLTWQPETLVSPNSQQENYSGYTNISTSPEGSLHVVWTEFQAPNGWPPTGVFYSRSMDGGLTWSPSLEIARNGYDQINVLSTAGGIVHLSWNGMVGVSGRYHKWSKDGGQTWSDQVTITREGATSGAPQMAIDSSGSLHLLTTYACAWYYRWNSRSWSQPECVSRNEAATTDNIEEAVMAITDGNRLHVVYWADRRRLWYTSTTTNSLQVPGEDFIPQTNSSSTATPLPHSTSTPGTTQAPPQPVTQTGEEQGSIQMDTSQILIISIMPVILIVTGAAILRRERWL